MEEPVIVPRRTRKALLELADDLLLQLGWPCWPGSPGGVLGCRTRRRRCSACRRATWVTFWAISEEPLAASARFMEISLVVLVCSSTAAAMALWMSEILLMISPMCHDGLDGALGVGLDHLDLLQLDVLEEWPWRSLWAKVLDLVGDDGEALAGLAGAGGLSMVAVQGDEVGLLGDGANDLDDVADLGAGLAELGDLDVGLFGHAGRPKRRPCWPRRRSARSP